MLFWGHSDQKPAVESRITLGHENTGVVVGLGSKVQEFRVGDKVGCLMCSSACCKFVFPRLQFKEDKDWDWTPRLNHAVDECEGCMIHNVFCEKGTGKLHGFTTDGHFAEYSLSDFRNSMVLPDGIDMISTAPLFCVGLTGQLLLCCPFYVVPMLTGF